MTDDEWTPWRRARRLDPVGPFSPCADCLQSYADEMRDLDLCDGIPGRDSRPPLPPPVIPVSVQLDPGPDLDAPYGRRRDGYPYTRCEALHNAWRDARRRIRRSLALAT